MTALISDRRAVDDALRKNPRAIDSSKWSPLKAELASIQDRVPSARTSAVKEPPYPDDVVKPPASEAAAIPEGSAPRVEITSRESDEKGLHLKGYLQGDDLKSAGIYDAEAMIQKIDLSPTTGQQRVLLDFTLEQVSPDETIRVADSAGRTAQARVASNTTATVESGGHEKMIELGVGGSPTEEDPPVELASRGPDNTAEIPSKSPSRRHMHENATLAPLDAQINILGVQQNLSSPSNYGITGQISGEGVSHAGIYVDGRMVKPIPVAANGDTSFNVSFTMLGEAATIRAYGNGSNFVESTLDSEQRQRNDLWGESSDDDVWISGEPVRAHSLWVSPESLRREPVRSASLRISQQRVSQWLRISATASASVVAKDFLGKVILCADC